MCKQSNCPMSLLKKQCKRKRFPCGRCGAKIVNAGLQWEISIPKYQQWFYMDPLTLAVNGKATASPLVTNAPRRLPNHDDETQADSPCKFDGPGVVEGFNLVQGQSPADGGPFVQDFDWQKHDDGFDGWNWFIRGHTVLVSWKAAEVDESSGDLITPGSWQIHLRINQSAQAYIDDYEDDTDNSGWFNLAVGGEYYSIYGGPAVIDPTAAYGNAALIQHTYYPPTDYDCLSKSTVRWTRKIPTLPALFGGYNVETLPSDYQWPENFPTHADGVLRSNTGPFFPVGFKQNLDIYYAPPYIEVRHTKK